MEHVDDQAPNNTPDCLSKKTLALKLPPLELSVINIGNAPLQDATISNTSDRLPCVHRFESHKRHARPQQRCWTSRSARQHNATETFHPHPPVSSSAPETSFQFFTQHHQQQHQQHHQQQQQQQLSRDCHSVSPTKTRTTEKLKSSMMTTRSLEIPDSREDQTFQPYLMSSFPTDYVPPRKIQPTAYVMGPRRRVVDSYDALFDRYNQAITYMLFQPTRQQIESAMEPFHKQAQQQRALQSRDMSTNSGKETRLKDLPYGHSPVPPKKDSYFS